MEEALELAAIMLAVGSPVIIIIFITQYFSYKGKVKSELSDLRKEFDSLNNKELTSEVSNLRKRISVLESIVTEKGYEVSEKISSL